MAAATNAAAAPNRLAITLCVGLATIMQALDTTIANVSLPYIQGSMGVNLDEVNWVLTSYIVAAAIMTPPTGFLAGRFGRKRMFLVTIVGFMIASMLCGMAGSIGEIVVFRLLQGAFGAGLVPLSQAVLLDTYPREQHGRAMAYWGMAVMIGPILGPVLGGWLTENVSWRWDFYINLPIGILAFIGMTIFLPETKRIESKLDWFGFAALSIATGALQLVLDRGEELNWFASGEIIIEAIVAAGAFWLFLVHTFTVRDPFIKPALFRDRNFTAGILFGTIIGVILLAPLSLLPPYMQNLMNYPVFTSGIAMAPRGVGTMLAMIVVGRLIGRVDVRLLLAAGLGLTAWALYDMTLWTPAVSMTTVMVNGIIQGAGLGFLFVPLSTVTFSTLPQQQRTEGTGIYTYTRNIGSSVGISIVQAVLVNETQINHATIGQYVTPFNRLFEHGAAAHFLSPYTQAGRALLDATVSQQALIIAYLDDFKLMMIVGLLALPLLLLFRRPSKGGTEPGLPGLD
ncbi:MAG TPA: DHA2 family efflux MFS transporter permease subunit [Stellaceae bacterium]|nr:DHA2 family efflux MFS transporter permease subunit [Stellaceae bacterium]